MISQLTEAKMARKQWNMERHRYDPNLPLLLQDLNHMELWTNILRRKQIGPQCFYQLVLPHEFSQNVLASLDDHMGIERTLDLVKVGFY